MQAACNQFGMSTTEQLLDSAELHLRLNVKQHVMTIEPFIHSYIISSGIDCGISNNSNCYCYCFGATCEFVSF